MLNPPRASSRIDTGMIENKSNAPTIQGTTCVILVAITCDSLMMKERCAAL